MQWSMVLLTSITQKKRWIYHIYIYIVIIYLYKYRAPAERGRNSLKDLKIILDLLMSNLSMSNSSFPRHQSRHGLPQTHWWRLVWDAIFDLVACSLRVSGSVAPVAMTNNHLWGIAAHLIKNQVWDRKRCITHSVNKDRSLLWPRVLGLGSWCTFLQKTIFEKLLGSVLSVKGCCTW